MDKKTLKTQNKWSWWRFLRRCLPSTRWLGILRSRTTLSISQDSGSQLRTNCKLLTFTTRSIEKNWVYLRTMFSKLMSISEE